MLVTPGYAGRGIGNPSLDWCFLSTPQKSAGSRSIFLSRCSLSIVTRCFQNLNMTTRGKMLGGSSGINSLAWGRASKPEYDAWAQISRDSSWSWDSLLPYFKKSESTNFLGRQWYPGITQDAQEKALQNLPSISGLSGPISVGGFLGVHRSTQFNNMVKVSHNTSHFEMVPTVVKTLNGMGVESNAEPVYLATISIPHDPAKPSLARGNDCRCLRLPRHD